MMEFCDPQFSELLTLHRINDFEKLWNMSAEPVEEPNYRRGGWSGVWRLPLADSGGNIHHYFLKRQNNHTQRRGPRFYRRPTFYFEYRNILLCRELMLPCLDVAYYGERKQPFTQKGMGNYGYRAILITPAIEDYTPFSEIFSGWDGLNENLRLDYLRHIACLAAQMHKKRLSHNGFYPKHLFVNLAKIPSVKMIDMERMKFQWWPARQSVFELERFVRRANGLANEEIEYFLERYWEERDLGFSFQGLKNRFQKRMKRKSPRKI